MLETSQRLIDLIRNNVKRAEVRSDQSMCHFCIFLSSLASKCTGIDYIFNMLFSNSPCNKSDYCTLRLGHLSFKKSDPSLAKWRMEQKQLREGDDIQTKNYSFCDFLKFSGNGSIRTPLHLRYYYN